MVSTASQWWPDRGRIGQGCNGMLRAATLTVGVGLILVCFAVAQNQVLLWEQDIFYAPIRTQRPVDCDLGRFTGPALVASCLGN